MLLQVPETARVLRPDALALWPLFDGYPRIARDPVFLSWTLLNFRGYAANFGHFSSSAYFNFETFGISYVSFGLVSGGALDQVPGRQVPMPSLDLAPGYRHIGTARRLPLVGRCRHLYRAPAYAGPHLVTLTAGLWLMLLAYGIHQPCGHVGMVTPSPLQAEAYSALGGLVFAVAAFLCGTWMGVMFEGGSSAVLAFSIGRIALTFAAVVRPHVASQPTTS